MNRVYISSKQDFTSCCPSSLSLVGPFLAQLALPRSPLAPPAVRAAESGLPPSSEAVARHQAPFDILTTFVSLAHSHNTLQLPLAHPLSAATIFLFSLNISGAHLLPMHPLSSLLPLTWVNALAS